MFEKLKIEISGDDFREGLTGIVSVKVPEPQFEGQTKPSWVTTKLPVPLNKFSVRHWSII